MRILPQQFCIFDVFLFREAEGPNNGIFYYDDVILTRPIGKFKTGTPFKVARLDIRKGILQFRNIKLEGQYKLVGLEINNKYYLEVE